MKRAIENVKGFLGNEEAATATEYAVVLGLIVVVSIAAMTTLGTKIKAIFTSVTTQMPSTP
jgi:pilus assembly protein Flp/PilA